MLGSAPAARGPGGVWARETLRCARGASRGPLQSLAMRSQQFSEDLSRWAAMKARLCIEHHIAFASPPVSIARRESFIDTIFYGIFVRTTSRSSRAFWARFTPHSGSPGQWLSVNTVLADHDSFLCALNCHVGLPSTWAVESKNLMAADSPRPRPTGLQG